MMDRTARGAVAAALALFVVVGAVQGPRPAAVAVPLAVVALLAAVVAVRGQVRGPSLVGVLAAIAAIQVVLCHGSATNLGWFGLCMVAGWIAMEQRVAVAGGMAAVLVAALVGEWVMLPSESGWGAWIAGTVFTTAACVAARRQRMLVEQLHEAQTGLAERSRAEERNRIAAEMHDVIGHALTVSVLHVSSARLSLDEDDPQAVRSSLEEAERLARESLEEVRAAVGLMRRPGGAGARPLPGAADLTDLVETFRSAGADVRLDVTGDLAEVGTARGLTIYRIVQESLTNAVRHGDGSSVLVVVRIRDGGADVRIDSGGPIVVAHDGAGIDGMRERAEAVGGRLSAGPGGDGWRVEAVLPS